MQLTQEIQVWSLGGEDPLEEEMTTHPSILPEKSHGQRSLVCYSSWAGHEGAHTSTINKSAMDFAFSSWSCYTWLIKKLVCPSTLLRKNRFFFLVCIVYFKAAFEFECCQEPAWGTPPMAKVMRKEALAYAKAGLSLRKPPVFEHLPPKPESVLCSHLHLWLYGGLSPITIFFREGANLQLQLIKILGRDKSVSTYKLFWRFSSLPEWVRPATCDCLQPPNLERHKML